MKNIDWKNVARYMVIVPMAVMGGIFAVAGGLMLAAARLLTWGLPWCPGGEMERTRKFFWVL